jgi:hypothetical protein
MMAKFLFFLTGSLQVPIGRFATGLNPIKIQKMDDPTKLPAAHTCFNFLDLPEDTSEEIFEKRLTFAILNTGAFELI